jgi:hypothetical protein
MRTLYAIAAMLLTVAGLPPSANAGGGKVRYQCQVFRLAGGFEQTTSLEKGIWEGSAAEWNLIKHEVTLFDYGEFRLGTDRLRINRHGCSWNEQKLTFEEGHRAALPEDRIKMLYSPDFLRRQGELVRMKIESRQPFQFMSRRSDGLFELEEITLPVGMDIKIKAEQPEKDVFLISYLEVELRTVRHREGVEGTQLPVGRPVLKEYEYKLRLRVRESKNYGVLLQPEGSPGAIIIRMEIDDR